MDYLAGERYDTEIRMKTAIDTKGLSTDVNKLAKEFDRLKGKFTATADSIRKQEDALADLKRRYEEISSADVNVASLNKMESALKKINKEVKEQEAAYAEVIKKIEQANMEMTAAKGMGDAAGISKAAQALDALDKESLDIADSLEKARESSERLAGDIEKIKLDPSTSREALNLADRIASAEEKLAETVGKADEYKAEMADVSDAMAGAGGKMSEMADKAATTTSKLSIMGTVGKAALAGIVVSSKALLSALGGLVAGIGKFTQIAAVGMGKLLKTIMKITPPMSLIVGGFKKATSGANNFLKRIVRLAAAVFVFNLIRKALNSLREDIGNLIKANESLSNSWNAIQVNVWTAFAPIWEAITPALEAFAATLARVTQAVATFFAMLGGKTYEQAKDSAKALYDQAHATDAAGKAAKKASKQLFAFDEINQAITEDAEDAAGAAGGAGLDFSDVEPPSNALVDWLDTFIAKLKEIEPDLDYFHDLGAQLSKKIADALKGIDWATIQAQAVSMAQKLAAFLNGIVDDIEFWDTLGDTLYNALKTALDFANTFLEDFHWYNFGVGLATMFNYLIELIPELGRLVYNLLHATLETANGFLDTFEWADFGAALAEAFNRVVKILPEIGVTLAKAVNAIFTTLRGLFENFDWTAAGQDIADGLTNLTNSIDWDNIAVTLAMGINGIFKTLHTAITGYDWKGLASKLANGLNSFIKLTDWKLIGQTLSDAVNAVFNSLYTLLTTFDWKQLGVSFGESVNAFIYGTDWDKVRETLQAAVMAVLNATGAFVQKTDWLKLGDSILRTLPNVKAGDFVSKIYDFVGGLLGTIIKAMKDSANWVWYQIRDFFIGLGQGGAKDLWDGLWQGLTEFSDNVMSFMQEKIFNPFMNAFKKIFGIHSPSTVMIEMGGYIMSGLLQGITDKLTSVIDFFKGLASKIKEVFGDIKQAIGDKFSAAWEGVQGIWNKASGWFDTNVSEKLKKGFGELWDKAKTGFSKNWEDIKSAWSVASGWFADKVISPTQSKFGEFWNKTKEGFTKAWESVRDAWQGASVWYADKVVNPTKDGFTKFWDVVKTGFTSNWESVKNAWNGASNWFSQSVTQPIQNGWRTAWSTIQSLASSTWGAIQQSFQSGVSGLSGALQSLSGTAQNVFSSISNAASSLWNGLQGLFNKISSSVSSVNISIPKFATGGIVTSPTIAMIGEAGTEAVVPLEHNTSWTHMVAEQVSAMLSAPLVETGARAAAANKPFDTSAIDALTRQMKVNQLRGGGDGGVNLTATLELDGYSLARATAKYDSDVSRQSGANLRTRLVNA